MPQFFINQPLREGLVVDITGKETHHIIDVLRLKVGDWLVLSDGEGKSFVAAIKSLEKKTVIAVIGEEIKRNYASPPPSLAFAIIKHDRTEYIIQKAVELGCANLIPFVSERTIPKYYSCRHCESAADGRSNPGNFNKLARWQKIALAAAKQSGLPFLPKVNTPISLPNLCKTFSDYEKVLLFWEGEKEVAFKSLARPPRLRDAGSHGGRVLLVIGPEGGFSKYEIDMAKKHKAATVSLGSQILRVETAAISALTIVQYELGNLG